MFIICKLEGLFLFNYLVSLEKIKELLVNVRLIDRSSI